MIFAESGYGSDYLGSNDEAKDMECEQLRSMMNGWGNSKAYDEDEQLTRNQKS